MPHRDREARLRYFRYWRVRNRERIRIYNQKYRQKMKDNPEFQKKASQYSKEYRKNHPEKKRQWNRRYHERHHEEVTRKDREREKRLKDFWRGNMPILCKDYKLRKQITTEAEIIACKNILPKLGFTDILPLGGQMFADALAKADGVQYAIEVTVYPYRPYRRKTLEVLKWLGVKHLVLFMTPDLKRYIIKENPKYIYPRIYLKDLPRLRVLR